MLLLFKPETTIELMLVVLEVIALVIEFKPNVGEIFCELYVIVVVVVNKIFVSTKFGSKLFDSELLELREVLEIDND